jgi:hypothetical protein
MGDVDNTHGRDEKYIQNFGSESCREETTEDLGVDGSQGNRFGNCGLDSSGLG